MSGQAWTFACARPVDLAAQDPCTARATVTGRTAALARVHLAMTGWQVLDDERGVLCPAHATRPARVSVPAARPQGDVPDPVRRPHRAPAAAGTGRLPTVQLLDEAVVRCSRCEDGEHSWCLGAPACSCTSTPHCGGTP